VKLASILQIATLTLEWPSFRGQTNCLGRDLSISRDKSRQRFRAVLGSPAAVRATPVQVGISSRSGPEPQAK
jgi:hypothetical protein